ALLSLFVGWIIWGRRGAMAAETQRADMARLRTELEECKSACKEKDDLIGRLEARLEGRGEGGSDKDTAPAAASAPAPAQFAGSADQSSPSGIKPVTLEAPRAGTGDNLKKIKGVGPKLEALCNRLGFWHFDQIANWTDAEVAWVDANLEGFKGRVSRDNWVAQAKVLATGGETEFSERVDAGEVYEDKEKD
ncbi:MAG: hypothetical protein AAF405_02050, partial [Pseudomonadota bacterium]